MGAKGQALSLRDIFLLQKFSALATLENSWGAFEDITVPSLHLRPLESEFLGVSPEHLD